MTLFGFTIIRAKELYDMRMRLMKHQRLLWECEEIFDYASEERTKSLEFLKKIEILSDKSEVSMAASKAISILRGEERLTNPIGRME